jgi:hypothetical protein
VKVKVDISIISISALDLEKMELRVEIYLEQASICSNLSEVGAPKER